MSFSSNFPTIAPSLNLDFASTKQLDSRITFTRASTATYYDGVTVAKAEENLLTYSQEFDNAAWTKTNATVTTNTEVAPDGTTTAEKIVEDAATGEHRISQLPTWLALTYTISVYLKAAERSFAFVDYGGAIGVSVDLTTGSATLAVGSPTNITSVNAGNGWWRVIFSLSASAGAGTFRIYASTDGVWANRSYAGTPGNGIYVWGAQLEQRSTVTAYTPTTTQPITNYIPVLRTAAAGVPRFDHNPTTGESLGLLIEEQRTNLLTRSAEFDNASWAKLGTGGSPAVLAAANQAVAPDGTLTADKLIAGTGAGTHYIQQSFSFVASTTYTLSMYVKAGESTVFRPGVFNGAICTFDAASGQFTSVSPGTTTTSTSVGNGWWRISMTATAGGTPPTRVEIYTANNNAGDGYSGIFIWGAQLEAGAFPTSYIPTVASSVTRVADVVSMTGANFTSWYRPDEGTLYAEYAITGFNPAASNAAFSVGDNTTNNFIVGRIVSPNVVNFSVRVLGVDQASITALNTATANAFFKFAGVYKFNDFAASANGLAAVTDTLGTIPTVDRAYIGTNSTATTNPLNGTIKKIAYYPLRLTNAQLQALTS